MSMGNLWKVVAVQILAVLLHPDVAFQDIPLEIVSGLRIRTSVRQVITEAIAQGSSCSTRGCNLKPLKISSITNFHCYIWFISIPKPRFIKRQLTTWRWVLWNSPGELGVTRWMPKFTERKRVELWVPNLRRIYNCIGSQAGHKNLSNKKVENIKKKNYSWRNEISWTVKSYSHKQW